jgi:hypothetical protein
MDGWDVAIWLVAAYLAVTALVRLMVAHRDKVLADFRAEMERQQPANPTQPPARQRAA